MTHRKLFGFCLLVFLLFISAGCGSSGNSNDQKDFSQVPELTSPDTPSPVPAPTSPDTPAPEPEPAPTSPDTPAPEPEPAPTSPDTPAPEPEPAPTSPDIPAPAPEPEPTPTPKPELVPTPIPEPTPEPTPTPAPSIPTYTPFSPDNPTPEPEIRTSLIVTFDSMGGSDVDEQLLQSGDLATRPNSPTMQGSNFLGWYPSESFSYEFDFNTPISQDTVLFAKWWHENDSADLDGEGLIDSLEAQFGTDPANPDTDDDGLTDWEEINWLNYNPLVKDSDGNGINDGDEDADGDGLENNLEGNYNASMIVTDTDHDGLNDGEEVKLYGTDPANPDTDGDGVDDGTEVRIGSDPLSAENTFLTEASMDRIALGISSVDITVRMNSSADAAGTLTVREAQRSDNVLVSKWIPGFLDAAYQIEAGGSFDEAEIEFTLSPELGTADTDTFKPRIYAFNSDTGELTELVDQTFRDGKIVAKVPHFSIYILLNKVAFDSVWDSTIRPPISADTTKNDATLDIAFVIDSSGSMSGNDPYRLAIELPKQFIAKLRDGKDKAAVVTFSWNSYLLSSLTDDKDVLTQALDSIYYDGNTNGQDGLWDGVNILVQSSDADYKYVVFMTDGEDNEPSLHPYDETISLASNGNIMIYTIGMGSAYEAVLRQIASQTGGEYYYAETAESGLSGIYGNIQGQTIDYTTDTNGDGISDYYTRLLIEGRMRIQNGTVANIALLRLLSNDAVVSRDWDGDGLPNSEELEIRGGLFSPYAFMKSDPTNPDTDEDGFTDYEEVNEMHTSPLRYTKNYAQALTGLRDDALYPALYIDFSKNEHAGDTWAFAWKLDEWARESIMNYFTTYSTDITVMTKADYDEQRYELYSKWAEINETLSNVLSLMSAFNNLASSLGTPDPRVDQETEVQEALKRMEETSKKVDAAESKILAAAEEDMKRQKSLKSEELKNLEDSLETFSEVGDLLAENMDILSEIKDVAQISTFAVNGVNLALQAENAIRQVPAVAKRWPIRFKSAEELVSMGGANASGLSDKISGGLSIAMDTLNTVKDVLEIQTLRGKVEKNYAEFVKYLDLLKHISNNYAYPKYVRDAALGLYETFLNARDPNWDRLNEELNKSLGTTLTRDGLKLALGVLVLVPGPQQPFVAAFNTIVAIVSAGVNLLGFEGKAELIVKSHIYYAITDGSNRLLSRIVNYAGDNSEYYELLPENFGNFDKYAVQLAQGRIVGMYHILNYIQDGSLTGLMDRGSGLLDILLGGDQAKKDAYKSEFEARMAIVYNFAEILELTLSTALPKP